MCFQKLARCKCLQFVCWVVLGEAVYPRERSQERAMQGTPSQDVSASGYAASSFTANGAFVRTASLENSLRATGPTKAWKQSAGIKTNKSTLEALAAMDKVKLSKSIPEETMRFLKREAKRHPHSHELTQSERQERMAATTVKLLRLFRPCAHCNVSKRYGSAHAGGFVMCEELMQGIKAAYSFGITGNDDWGVAVSQSLGGIPVYELDCSKKQRPVCPKAKGKHCNLHFTSECLGNPEMNNDLRTFRSLREHLQRHSPLGREEEPKAGGDMLLKIDIEGKEWNTLLDARMKDLRRMRQMVIEFHSISRFQFHDFFLKSLRRILNAGFVIVHIHGSNLGSMALFGNGRYKLADTLQVTFVNELALPSRSKGSCVCAPDRTIEDAPDNPYSFDLPRTELPEDHDTISVSRLPVMKCRWLCSVFSVVMLLGPVISFSLLFLMALFLLSLVLCGGGFHHSPSKGRSFRKSSGVGHIPRSERP